MRRERRWWWIGLAIGAGILCIWCGLFAAVGGWVAGRDIGRREARIEIRTTTATQAELPELGVLVTRVDRTGPAMRAGIVRGDLIVALGATRVQDARDLRDLLATRNPGDTVILTVLRDRTEQNITVILDAFPGTPRAPYLGVYYTARGEEPADL